MKKRLLLIGYNFSPEPTGIGKYSGEMISWMVERGYDCTVITSYPYYPFWKIQKPYRKRRFWYTRENFEDTSSGGKLKIYRCPQYVPNKPSGLKRIILDVSFILSACLPVLRLLFGRKFDFVMSVAPSFQVGLLGLFFKRFHKAKLVYHIQDLQIEAARDLNLIKYKPAIKTLFRIEKFIFNHCDVISSISNGMVMKIQEKAKKEVMLFPNWSDTKTFYPISNKVNLRKKFGYQPSDKIILYSGSIGEKQGLDSILHVASQIQYLPHVKFIICGSGPYKTKLQELAAELNLQNVTFFPIQPHENFNRFLNLADVHLVIQRAGATDLVMPSKLTTILSVGGLAVVTADAGSGLHSLIKEHNIGVLTAAENTVALKECILDVVFNDFSHINKNARQYAEIFLSLDKIMFSFEEFIQNRKTGYNQIPVQFTAPGVSDIKVPKVAVSRSEVPVVPDSKS
jgi:colanic acid biosynthesis glycosyl transferase WcaI